MARGIPRTPPPGADPRTTDLKDLKSGVFNPAAAGSIVVEQYMPYLQILNGDTVAHVFTLTLRPPTGQDNPGPVTLSIPAASNQAIPTLPFGGCAIDAAASTVFWFYTDVPVAGPSPAAGGGTGTATTITHDFGGSNISPNADATFLMAGLGSTLTLKPLKSGVVKLTVTVRMTELAANDGMNVLGAFGTGGAPALHAAATGTPSGVIGFLNSNVGALTSESVAFSCTAVFLGLVVGTTYWFDLQVQATTAANAQILAYVAIVEELPS